MSGLKKQKCIVWELEVQNQGVSKTMLSVCWCQKQSLAFLDLQLYNSNLCLHQQIVIFLCVLTLSSLKTPVTLD